MLRSTFRCFLRQTVGVLAPPTVQGPVPRRLRLHGTVTAFKHRRGYGFVLAEGVARSSVPSNATRDNEAASAQTSPENALDATENDAKWLGEYFFTRGALGGGFYVTEGERISFGIRPLTPSQLEARRSHAARRHGATDAVVDDGNDDATSGTSTSLHVASRITFYDSKTGQEAPITPPVLCGKIVSWDESRGEGVISELDTRGYFHEDAPRFAFSLADTDFAEGIRVAAGRFVRFAAAGESSAAPSLAAVDEDAGEAEVRGAGEPRAERIIIDNGNERRHAVQGTPLSPDTTHTRFHGVVRDIVDDKFGFVLDDLSGDSIFFHISGVARGARVVAGDRVSYLLREITMGKHTGKKTCVNVRGEAPGEDGSSSSAASSLRGSSVGAGSASMRSSTSGFGGPSKTHDKRKQRAPAEDDDDDFSLLD